MKAGDLEALNSAKRPEARHNTGVRHVEVDISRQVLFLVEGDGTVKLVLPVSTGNEKKYLDKGKWQIAHTPRGQFEIERKINGVRKASLGNLYYPSYFYGGVAIHGSPSVPVRPASHGCVRIPRFADQAFFKMVKIGTEVYVYD
jgi:lipoprotein-anchoring transpeptidase ErfK/SrfK